MRHRFLSSCGCISFVVGTLTKRWEKNLDENYTRMLRNISNKFWKKHSTKQQLYGHSPSISKTIQIRWKKHARNFWGNRDKLKSDVLLELLHKSVQVLPTSNNSHTADLYGHLMQSRGHAKSDGRSV